MNLSVNSLYSLYLKIEDIWNYRLQLSDAAKKKIIPEK